MVIEGAPVAADQHDGVVVLTSRTRAFKHGSPVPVHNFPRRRQYRSEPGESGSWNCGYEKIGRGESARSWLNYLLNNLIPRASSSSVSGNILPPSRL